MEKLNKRLAEWRWGKDNLEVSTDGRFIYYHTTWNEGDQEWNIEPVPDFPQSLDACFKWLVPKLNELGWGIGIMPCGPIHSPLWYADMFNIQKELHIRETNPREDTPALALCLAIEKLIEKERNL